MRGRITDKLVKEVRPSSGDTFVWDDEVKGFGIKVTAKGRRTFVFQYRMGGRDTPTSRVTIGLHGRPWSIRQARAEAERLTRLVASGQDPRLKTHTETRTAEPFATVTAAADWRIRLSLLVTDIARLQGVTMRRNMEAIGGSSEQLRMLGELSLRQGQSQAELAKALNVSKVAVSGLVARATRAGWIEHRAHPTDRRTRRLYLTSQARTSIAAMRVEIDAMNDQIYAATAQNVGEHTIMILERLRQGWLAVARQKAATDFS